jgi:hypothetical protein
MIRNKKLTLKIILVIVVVLSIAGVMWQFSLGNDYKTLSDGTIDCGKHSFEKEAPYNGCFEDNFNKCNPAQIIIFSGTKFDEKEISSAVNSLTVLHKIKEKQGARCLVEFQYLSNDINQEWNNKPLICAYSTNTTYLENLNKQDVNFNGCTGPLIEAMNKI